MSTRQIKQELHITVPSTMDLFVNGQKLNKSQYRAEDLTFDMVGLKPGDHIEFRQGDIIKDVIITDNKNHISYNNQHYTLSKAAMLFAAEHGEKITSKQGAEYFYYKGEKLVDRRAKMVPLTMQIKDI